MPEPISEAEQLKELTSRIPPVVNVDIVLVNNWRYLVGQRPQAGEKYTAVPGKYLFPGSRMKYTETIQETAERVLQKETPGVKAHFAKIITVLNDKGYDKRANGVTIYVLMNYLGGTAQPNESFKKFAWVNQEEYSKLEHYELDLQIFKEIDATVRNMNTTEDEVLVEVNAGDEEVGMIIKRIAHNSTSRYHRAAHIMIFNTHGEIILQKRTETKVHNPGRWDMTGGHQIYGDTIEETAKKELMEEMGLKTELHFLRKGIYLGSSQSEIYYLYWGIDDGPYNFDPNEVAQIKAYNCNELLADRDKHSEILDHVFGYLEEMRPIWEPLVASAQKDGSV